MNFAVIHGGSQKSTKLFATTTGRCRLGMFSYITATQLLPSASIHCFVTATVESVVQDENY